MNFLNWFIVIFGWATVVLLVVMGLSGCQSFTPGPFNKDTFQDGQCYAKYGGQWGYCDRNGNSK
jgi:hypothetical protein